MNENYLNLLGILVESCLNLEELIIVGSGSEEHGGRRRNVLPFINNLFLPSSLKKLKILPQSSFNTSNSSNYCIQATGQDFLHILLSQSEVLEQLNSIHYYFEWEDLVKLIPAFRNGKVEFVGTDEVVNWDEK